MNTNNILLSPSMLASDLTRLGTLVEEFDASVIDLLHMDVMDGNFVPNITFGPGYISQLKKHTDIPLDVHLMIEKPELSIEEYLKSDPWCVTIHYESTRFPIRLINEIKKAGTPGGISINPATPVEVLYDVLPYCDMVLVMSVDPGFGGQSFMPEALVRIKKLKHFIDKEGLNVKIQVDGGITTDNIGSVVNAGATVIVAGSSTFKGGRVNENAAALKKAALTD